MGRKNKKESIIALKVLGMTFAKMRKILKVWYDMPVGTVIWWFSKNHRSRVVPSNYVFMTLLVCYCSNEVRDEGVILFIRTSCYGGFCRSWIGNSSTLHINSNQVTSIVLITTSQSLAYVASKGVVKRSPIWFADGTLRYCCDGSVCLGV